MASVVKGGSTTRHFASDAVYSTCRRIQPPRVARVELAVSRLGSVDAADEPALAKNEIAPPEPLTPPPKTEARSVTVTPLAVNDVSRKTRLFKVVAKSLQFVTPVTAA